MKKIQKYCFITLLICGLPVLGQQIPNFSQYNFGDMSYNPGAAGSHDMVCLTALTRQQWTGFKDGAPSVSYFNANTPFSLFGADHGVGVSFNNEEIGFNSNIGINLAYAYRADVDNGKLGIGVSFGLVNEDIKPDWKYPESGEMDAAIPTVEESKSAFDMGIGVFYRKDQLFAGFSAIHLLNSRLNYVKSENLALKPYLVRHYYLVGGYQFTFNENFDFQPSFLIESDGYANQLEANFNVIYNNKIWGGVSYRVGSAIIGMFGLELFEDVKVGYAYDFTTTALREYGSGSHELMIRYCFEIVREKIPEQYHNIRHLY